MPQGGLILSRVKKLGIVINMLAVMKALMEVSLEADSFNDPFHMDVLPNIEYLHWIVNFRSLFSNEHSKFKTLDTYMYDIDLFPLSYIHAL